MYKAKALYGERAGEFVFAKEHGLTHEMCQQWKLVCPECRQFLYFNESKDPEIRRSWFSHPDDEDKNCPERNSSGKGKSNQEFSAESHEQDLETAELFVEQVFYGIDPEYFQNLNQQDNEQESQHVVDAINWFKASLLHDCKNWVRYYCITTGFLDWNDSEREISYLMDWLYILARREYILRSLVFYFSSETLFPKKDVSFAQEKFGLSKEQMDSSSSIWLIALDKILERLANFTKDGFTRSKLNLSFAKIFIERKIPSSNKKTPFKGKFQYAIVGTQMPVLIRESRGSRDWIVFSKQHPNHFCYGRQLADSLESNAFNFSKDDAVLLYIDGDGDLAIKGFIKKEYGKFVAQGISKILLNGSFYSMLVFLRAGFISEEIAEKVAQLALEFEYGKLTPTEALQKFRKLSG